MTHNALPNRSSSHNIFFNHRSLWVAFFALFILGLYSSLKVALGTFGIEPDAVHSLMLWYGVSEHGITWVKDWIFTQDNWLFSLVPIHFIEFWLFGTNPALVIITGWLIFISSSIMAGFIARQLNANSSFYIVPVILIFTGLYAHKYGLISYSTSHNITNLFGILSTYTLLKWHKNKEYYLLSIILLLNIAGGISDPWMIPSYTLPTSFVGAFMMLRGTTNQDKISGFILVLTMLMSVLLVKSLFFGLLDFLTHMHFNIGDLETIKGNFFYLTKDVGRLLDIIPLHESHILLQSIISVIAVFSLYAAAIWSAVRYNTSFLLQAFFYLSFFSISGTSFALLISSEPATDMSARFVINILYLTTIYIAVTIEQHWAAIPVTLKATSIVVAILFVASGFSSTYQLLIRPGFSIKTNVPQELMEFLKKENLNYGYGPYWATAANAVTVLSKSEIKLRPIQFDKNTGMPVFSQRPETSKRWYTDEDIPNNQSTFFAVVTYDVEECLVPMTCKKGLIMKYGPPEKLLYFKGHEILVWKKPLI